MNQFFPIEKFKKPSIDLIDSLSIIRDSPSYIEKEHLQIVNEDLEFIIYSNLSMANLKNNRIVFSRENRDN